MPSAFAVNGDNPELRKATARNIIELPEKMLSGDSKQNFRSKLLIKIQRSFWSCFSCF